MALRIEADCVISRPQSLFALVLAFALLVSPQARAEDRLLQEAVSFTGTLLFLKSKVPGLVIGAVRNGEKVVVGFGERADGSGAEPDGKTVLRIGSLTKAFTGGVLASLAADRTVALTDPLAKTLGWPVAVPTLGGRTIRLIDLVTHAGGLPREVEHESGPPNDPFRTLTKEAFIAGLKNNPLLFPPGTGALYSNFGFDLLSAALEGAARKPYPELLAERITRPLSMADTVFQLTEAQRARLMQGHGFKGEPLPDVPTGPMTVGSGGLYSTPDDVLRWLAWHLDRFGTADAEARLLAQASYLRRDGLSPALGLDESGHMDAMGLAWIVMDAKGSRPLILQKAGGLQGMFSYTAFAPTRGVGVFVAINTFDLGVAMEMAAIANDLIATLAPR